MATPSSIKYPPDDFYTDVVVVALGSGDFSWRHGLYLSAILRSSFVYMVA